MLVQATTPRPVFDPSRHPRYIYIHTLRKPGVSNGEVYFSGPTNPELGEQQGRPIEPVNVYPIEGQDGFQALEYVLPFFELFKEEDKKRNLALVPFCSAGFPVTVKSAFRSTPQTYEEHTVAFKVLMPVTGGGVIRLSDCLFDLTNSSFDPWAPNPNPIRNLELADVYNRTHRLASSSDEARRLREERIRSAEAGMALQMSGKPSLSLKDKRTRRLGPGKH